MKNTNLPNFSWIPIFKELAQRLLEYENRQKELVQLLENIGIEKRMPEGEENEPLEAIEPFTFLCLIMKHGTERRLYTYLKYYKAKKVALVYLSSTNTTKTALYYNEETRKLGNSECAVIQFAPEENLHKWQERICEVINQWKDRD